MDGVAHDSRPFAFYQSRMTVALRSPTQSQDCDTQDSFAQSRAQFTS